MHARAGRLESASRRGADPARGAGDDRPSAVESRHPREPTGAGVNGPLKRIGLLTSKFSQRMQPLERNTGRNARLALVALALLALLAVVAFASRSGFGHSSNAQPTPGYVNYAFTAFLIVFVLAIPVAVWGFMMQAREGGFKRKSFRARVIQNLLTVAFFIMIGIVIIYIKRHHAHLFGNNDSGLRKVQDTLNNAHARQTASKYNPQFEWTVFWIALVGIVATAAALYYGHRRRQAPQRGRRSTMRRRSPRTSSPRCPMRSTTWRPSPTRDAP